MAMEEIYIRSESETEARGPFNLEQLVSLADTGQVTAETLFYDANTEQWSAIGSNEEATRLTGINTRKYKLIVYALAGLLTGIGALLYIARINSGHPGSGNGYELNAIAAVVIGGTSLSGGRGSIVGTMIGALIMGVISNGLNLMNIDPYFQNVVLGAVIILAVMIDQHSQK